MKKVLLIILSLALILSACSKAESRKTDLNTEDKNTPTVTENITTTVQPTEIPAEKNNESAENTYPSSFSWKDDEIIMTPQDQNPLGSCAVFASLSMFETHIAITTGELPNLSEMHFISVSPKWSNETGVSPEDVLNFITDYGTITEEKLPYNPPQTGVVNVENDFGYDYMLTADWGSELLDGKPLEERIEIIKRNLLEHGPIITNIGLFNDLGRYESGIYNCNTNSGVVAGHWLVILGWEDDETLDSGGYWICKNSWGTNWGEDGFCRMAYGDDSGIDDYILYYIDTPKEDLDKAMSNLEIANEFSFIEPDADFLSTYTLEELQTDFDLFVETLLSNNTFTFSDMSEFEKMAKSLRNDLKDNMNEIEFYRILSKMLCYINCSHSRVSLANISEYAFRRNNYFMPFDVEYRGDRMYIISDNKDIGIPLGSEILSVNGNKINQVVEEIYSMLPSDGQNATYKKKLINEQFYYLYNLLYDNSGMYCIKFKNSKTNALETISFVGVSNGQAETNINNLRYGNRLDYQIQSGYVYLRISNFNTIGGYTIQDYEDFFSDFFNEINELKISNLIIDVRDNNGGHPDAANILLSYLASSPFQYFDTSLPPAYPNLQEKTPVRDNNYKGTTYVICDGGSLSTTGHFLALFKYHNMGFIVGEESGAGHTVTDSSFDTILPNTNITLRTSSVKWNVAVNATGSYRGVLPHYPFTPSIEDIINGIDSTLDYTIALIKEK